MGRGPDGIDVVPQVPVTNDRLFTLEATDFGPLGRACVELRPLTVFVGPSNTGKSWLATLTYALHRHFGSQAGWTPWYSMAQEEEETLPEDTLADLVRIAENWTLPAPGAEPVALTERVRAAIRSHLETHADAIGAEIQRYFGVDSGHDLIQRGAASRTRILLRHAVEEGSALATQELTFGSNTWAFRPTVPSRLRARPSHFLRRFVDVGAEDERLRARSAWEAIRALARDVLPLRRRAYYLPADRTGLMSAHSTVVSALLRSATKAGSRGAGPVPPMSGVRGDFLEELVEMASAEVRRARARWEPLLELGERIERQILGGAVSARGAPGVPYPRFTYRPQEWKSGIPLTNASSMVSEIAPVVLYLRHVIAPGDLLIIDEPESHLHPAMQVVFTRRIAEMVQAGVRVIVTTHSEWVLEALGNVVGRPSQKDRRSRESEGVRLAAHDVGVWLFEPAEGGVGSSTVREIELDADTGLYPSGFDAVATALHNEWAEVAGTRGDDE